MPLKWIQIVLICLTAASTGYCAACIIAAWRFSRRPKVPSAPNPPPASILVPLCGADFEAYENYASLCHQDYPSFQIIFGVADPRDSSIPVVEKLMEDFPGVDIELVVSSNSLGANLKVTNLNNMLPHAKHQVIVLLDSDIRVGPDYLSTIISELGEESVALVTCLYRAGKAPNLPARMLAAGITTEFAPGVLVAWLLGTISFAFGATIAVTREKLEAIGGFPAIADHLADDYMLGLLITRLGHEVRLSSCIVEILIPPLSFGGMFKLQVRWARAIRACRPWGHLGSLITHGTPLALLCTLVHGGSPGTLALLGLVVACRMAVSWIVGVGCLGDGILRKNLWLLPVRDCLGFSVWLMGQFGRRVEWRGRTYRLIQGGKMEPV